MLKRARDKAPPSNGGPQTRGEHTRRAVLDAAIVRFGRDGYRATSVTDIARDASVGGTVAYIYFPGKEALFLAAADEDSAAVIHEGLSRCMEDPDWRQALMRGLLAALDRHPLAKRLLAGLEPEVTGRVLETPALAELRTACADQLRSEQRRGIVRPDVDPVSMANGIVPMMLSLLMAVVQIGSDPLVAYGKDIAAVIDAALEPPGGSPPGRPRRQPPVMRPRNSTARSPRTRRSAR
ncbi:MAG TPA: TetR/AcrR family transcriptional regulator [Acidimicrobiales bacterium]|nr:TetR/AcrR family transcriptional regulator [Acidimicrobiales bacterium]